jgi:hypothetical protein
MGCGIDPLSMEESLGPIEGFICFGKPHQHGVVDVDKLVEAGRPARSGAASSRTWPSSGSWSRKRRAGAGIEK